MQELEAANTRKEIGQEIQVLRIRVCRGDNRYSNFQFATRSTLPTVTNFAQSMLSILSTQAEGELRYGMAPPFFLRTSSQETARRDEQQQRRSLIENDRGFAVPRPNCGHGSLIENDHGSAVPGQICGRESLIENDHGSAVPGQICGGSVVPQSHRWVGSRGSTARTPEPPISITRGVDVIPLASSSAVDETSTSQGLTANGAAQSEARGRVFRCASYTYISHWQWWGSWDNSTIAVLAPMHYRNRRCSLRASKSASSNRGLGGILNSENIETSYDTAASEAHGETTKPSVFNAAIARLHSQAPVTVDSMQKQDDKHNSPTLAPSGEPAARRDQAARMPAFPGTSLYLFRP